MIELGITFVCPDRCDAHRRHGNLALIRQRIESIFNTAERVELAGTEFRMTIPAAHRLDGSAAAQLRAISTRPPHTVKYQMLVQRREILGADHPETLEAADDLVDALIVLNLSHCWLRDALATQGCSRAQSQRSAISMPAC